ncbi:Ferric/cupric reductase transmembrane component 1 [Pseudocercospora fuligena]|uniref:Ferric/cupric reductase transmembrane component 1 n=1 Tax=Pseudocercospora fuligena TaxID=685502 RepID=A0A8H6R515_9PEZI|nr:Ferric/cupric reductase transmembrane component 1 [Pseudocercospora fuligena]
MSAGAQGPAAAAAAAAAAEQRREELFAEWLAKNHNTARYWAAATGGLIGLFVVSHWSQNLYSRHLSRKPNALRSTVRAIAKPIQRLSTARSLGPITILPEKVTLAMVYFAINAALTFYDAPQQAPMKTMLSKRFGWMSLLNLLFTVFLGLKNTPLSPLAGYSFDSLNILHRCVGYTTILYMILHSTTYTAFLFESGFQSVLAEPKEYAGAVSGFAMLALLATSIGPVRKRFYEIFYASHIILVAIIIIALGLHRPEYMLKAFIITTLSGALWLFDQAFRLSRWIYHGHNSTVTLQPLPGNATLVKFSKPITAAPGSSVFLWIPSIRKFQRHPFTLVSASPQATFLIKSRNGFTKSLYDTACKNPGVPLKASLEGPYGHVPNVHNNYEKVVLIAGGSGVTFTMALALEWLKKRKTPKDMRKLEFYWCVRNQEFLEWFEEEFKELRKETERVSVRVFCTCNNAGDEGSDESETSSLEKESIGGDEEKLGLRHLNLSRVAVRGSGEEVRRIESGGRPDVRTLVSNAMEGLSEDDRVLVAACGPEGLLNDVRKAVAVSRVAKAPSIEMFLEEFSF